MIINNAKDLNAAPSDIRDGFIARLAAGVNRWECASLSRADFKLGLLEMGELDNVQALMDDPATDPRIKIMWEDSGRFERMHPDLLQLAEVMGYTEEQLDELFGVNI